MTINSFKWFALFGIGLLVAGIFAVRYLFRIFKAKRVGLGWFVAEGIGVIVGLAAGLHLNGFRTQISATVQIVGFPFLIGFDKLRHGRWEDYVGPLMLPAAFGNIAVGFLTPHLILATVVWFYLRRRQNAPLKSE